jgi:hypothetical protein
MRENLAMTDEELAKHWNVSLNEAKSISDFMNKNYYLCVGKSKKDNLFYGLMYRVDKKHGPMLVVSSKQGYKTSKEAAITFNKVFDTLEMPEMKAKLIGVPVDAYKALKKIDTSTMTSHEKSHNMCRGRGSRE